MTKGFVPCELFVHFKQGDDFKHVLENTEGGNVAEALRTWGAHLAEAAEGLKRFAAVIDGHAVEADADTNCVWLQVPSALMPKIEGQGFDSIGFRRQEDSEEDLADVAPAE